MKVVTMRQKSLENSIEKSDQNSRMYTNFNAIRSWSFRFCILAQLSERLCTVY